MEEKCVSGAAKLSRLWRTSKDAGRLGAGDLRNGVIVLIRIAICDDEIGTCSEIENMILNYARLQALQIDTEVFYSGEALFKAIEDKDDYELVFLDIQLLQLDGVEVGKRIREQLGNEKISIVYISSKETYAMSLFQIRPLDFLIKPITQKSVNETVGKYIRLNNLRKKDFFFHIGKSIQRLCLDEIYYFACNGKKIEIYTAAGVTAFYGTMQEVVKQVEGKGFWTIHKSYIVNSSYVSVYQYDAVQMTDGTVLPISQKYRKLMKSRLTDLYRRG